MNIVSSLAMLCLSISSMSSAFQWHQFPHYSPSLESSYTPISNSRFHSYSSFVLHATENPTEEFNNNDRYQNTNPIKKNKNKTIKKFFVPDLDQESSIQSLSLNPAFSSVELSSSKNEIDILNPCIDFSFKRAMETPVILSNFLNTILNFSKENEIQNIIYLNKELPSSDLLGKDFIVDILCETANGKRFLIEMQNDYRGDYANKAMAEFCRLIAYWDQSSIRQIRTTYDKNNVDSNETNKVSKRFWSEIDTAITIVITNKQFSKNTKKGKFPNQKVMEPEVINTYRFLHESDTGRNLGNIDARIVILALANFHKDENALETREDKWLYAFKDENLLDGVRKLEAYKHINNIEKVVDMKDPGLQQFYQKLNKEFVGNEIDLKQYEDMIKNANNVLSERENKGRAEGRAEGEAIGLEKGKAEEKRSLFLKKKARGKTDNQIMDEMEITQEELTAIKESIEN